MNRARDCSRGRGTVASRASAALSASRLVQGVTALGLAGVAPAIAGAQQRAAATPPLAFDGVTVVDVERGKLVPRQRVVIAGTRIKAVGAMDAIKLPRGTLVVDARGKYLIPGLWDVHSHLWTDWPTISKDFYLQGFPLLVANGVTGIREAYLRTEHSIDWHRRLQREVLAGQRVGPPRQLLAFALNSGAQIGLPPTCHSLTLSGSRAAPTDPTVRLCGSTELRRLVDSIKAAGYDMLKMYSLRADEYFAVAAAARHSGIRFGGHAADVSPIAAADSGASIFDHMNRASAGELESLCFLSRQATAESCGPVADAFRRHNSWSVPTLSVFLAEHSGKAYDEFRAGSPVRPGWLNHAAPLRLDSLVPADVRQRFPDSATRFRCGPITLRVAAQAGLPIAAGTDQPEHPGFALHEELWLLAECGLSPLAALQAATLNPATLFGLTDSLGTVAPGKLADLVLLDADPLEDITNTTRIRAVVANGRYFDRAALDRVLAEARAQIKEKP